MTERSLRRHAARGGAIVLATQAARVVVQLGGTIALARYIAPSDFGLLAMVVAIAGIAEIFRDFGLSQSALRRTDLTQQQRSNLFWLNTLSGLVLALMLFSLAPTIASFYGRDALAQIVRWVAPVCLLGGIASQFRVHINVALRFKALAVIDVLAPLTATIAAVVLAARSHPIAALIAMQALGPLLMTVLTVALARWWPSLPKRTGDMRGLLTFGTSFAFTQLMSYATRNVDSIALGRVRGARELGYYDRAFQLAAAPLNQVNAPLSRVAIPLLARVIDDRPKYVSALREAQLIQSYVTATALLVAAGLGTPLITVLLGDDWRQSGQIFSVLAVGSVFRSIQQIAYWMYMSQGLAAAQLRLYLVGQPAIVACILIGLHWGALGVATGSTIGWAAFWAASLWWVGRSSDVQVRGLMLDPLRVITAIGLPAGGLAMFVNWTLPLSAAWVLAAGSLAAATWICAMVLVVGWVRRDIRILARFARSGIRRGH